MRWRHYCHKGAQALTAVRAIAQRLAIRWLAARLPAKPYIADMPTTAQQIADMAKRAQQEGATHHEFSGPAVWFYRTHGGKVERCFAEYIPGPMRYYWVWEPPDGWTECEEIPEGAKPISELLK